VTLRLCEALICPLYVSNCVTTEELISYIDEIMATAYRQCTKFASLYNDNPQYPQFRRYQIVRKGLSKSLSAGCNGS
jgi:hypothetical protein